MVPGAPPVGCAPVYYGSEASSLLRAKDLPGLANGYDEQMAPVDVSCWAAVRRVVQCVSGWSGAADVVLPSYPHATRTLPARYPHVWGTFT